MRAVAGKDALGVGLAHDAVETVQHARGVAAGVVAGQQVAAQPFDDKGFGRLEDARVGPAEAVDALLGIAHQEDLQGFAAAATTARAGIGRQPGAQGLPLQGAGVLELVHQHLAHLAVQALLHPAGEGLVAEQAGRGQLQVGHVGQAAFALESGVLVHHQPAERDHLAVQDVGVLLGAGLAQVVEPGLGPGQLGRIAELLARVALAVFGEQGLQEGVHAPLHIGLGQRQCHGFAGLGRLAARLGRGLGTCQRPEAVVHRCAGQRLVRVVQACPLCVPLGGRRHAGGERTALLCQEDLQPVVQGLQQPGLGVVAAGCADDGVEGQPGVVEGVIGGGALRPILLGCRRLGLAPARQRVDAAQATRPQLGPDGFGVFQQLQLGRQVQLGEQVQRRGLDQAREPTVDGVDFHAAATGQPLAMQSPQARRELGQARFGHAAQAQFGLALRR